MVQVNRADEARIELSHNKQRKAVLKWLPTFVHDSDCLCEKRGSCSLIYLFSSISFNRGEGVIPI